MGRLDSKRGPYKRKLEKAGFSPRRKGMTDICRAVTAKQLKSHSESGMF